MDDLIEEVAQEARARLEQEQRRHSRGGSGGDGGDDKDGDARIDFGAEIGKLWVSRAQFRKMHKLAAAAHTGASEGHHASRVDGFWMPLATWNRFKSDTLKARVFGGAANPRNWYPDVDFILPIPPICYIPETLPLSAHEAVHWGAQAALVVRAVAGEASSEPTDDTSAMAMAAAAGRVELKHASAPYSLSPSISVHRGARGCPRASAEQVK